MSFTDAQGNSVGQGATPYAVSFGLSPIVLVNGIATGVTGGMLPILSLMSPGAFPSGILSGSTVTDIDQYFAWFTVLSGGTLLENIIAKWPLANLTVAANDQIAQPLRLMLRMTCPAQTFSGGTSLRGKQSIMTALATSLGQHVAQGGWFNVVTPSFLYSGMLLTALRDVTDYHPGGQVQEEWQWEFEQPLITTQAAQALQNTTMTKISNGTKTSGDPVGSSPVQASVGSPISNVTPNLIPAGSSQQATAAPQASASNSAAPPVSAIAPVPVG